MILPQKTVFYFLRPAKCSCVPWASAYIAKQNDQLTWWWGDWHLSNCFFKRCQEFHELPICGSPCTCEITESLSSMCQNEAVPGLFHLPPTDVPQFRQNAWPKNPNTCCSSDWLLVTSKKVREWITLGSPHMTPKGCSLHFRLPASQTALSVQSFSW